jgi:DNA-binding MarR family transcriptional regulator
MQTYTSVCVPFGPSEMPRIRSPRRRSSPSLHSLLTQASRQVTSDLRRLVSSEGLPVEFWRVLEVLADERGRSMSELAEDAGMQMSATSKLVDRMTEAALIQRSADPQDQRRVILHISDFGLQKVAALRDDVREQRSRLANSFSADRERQLRELLEDFIEAQRQGA